MTTNEIINRAVATKTSIAALSEEQRRNALIQMANALREHSSEILEQNKADVDNASEKLSPSMIDRLSLSDERIEGMAKGIEDVAKLPDPLNRILEQRTLYNGLELTKIPVPIGVVAMIYEARPNVTGDAAALSVMSGNACVLRGGKEAINTNLAVANALKDGLKKAGISPDAVGMVEDTDRKSSVELMEAIGRIDLLIPRGSAGLINACVEKSKVPCIQTGSGICHIYVDRFADLKKAVAIVDNAKTQRPSVCNAAEVCIVDEDIADEFLPMLYDALVTEKTKKGLPAVRFIADERAEKTIPSQKAEKGDFDREFLDYIMAIKTVKNVEEAVEHIALHSTGHSECIVTESKENADIFTRGVDSAAVYVNASTRFTDGGEYGFGCEIGISTQKLHVRGPMGLEALTSYKYIICGNGQTR